MKHNWSGLACLAAFLGLLTACSEIDYCAQCVSGQIDVMSRRRPITEVLKDPSVPDAERKQLAKVLEIRSFAVDKLGLPDNDSYRLYANINRPYVVWNVVATPEFSMTPKQWCYPVVGCVAYRGYFDAESAKATGVALAEQGYDVDVYGVKAYSTLRWFNDPVLNTFIDGTDSQLASLIFHELAHQVVYVPDDTSFNEAFAKTVENEGLHRWLLGNANDQEWQAYLDRERRGKEFIDMLRQAREQLLCLYAQPLQDADKRAEKQKILAGLEETLRNRQKQWTNPKAIDGWLARGLNNARLASIATYEEKVPAFQALLASKNGDLAAFYIEVNRLAQLPAKERAARLNEFGTPTQEVACRVR